MWSQVPFPLLGTLAADTRHADATTTIPQQAANPAGVSMTAMAVMLTGKLADGSRRPAEVGEKLNLSPLPFAIPEKSIGATGFEPAT